MGETFPWVPNPIIELPFLNNNCFRPLWQPSRPWLGKRQLRPVSRVRVNESSVKICLFSCSGGKASLFPHITLRLWGWCMVFLDFCTVIVLASTRPRSSVAGPLPSSSTTSTLVSVLPTRMPTGHRAGLRSHSRTRSTRLWDAPKPFSSVPRSIVPAALSPTSPIQATWRPWETNSHKVGPQLPTWLY